MIGRRARLWGGEIRKGTEVGPTGAGGTQSGREWVRWDARGDIGRTETSCSPSWLGHLSDNCAQRSGAAAGSKCGERSVKFRKTRVRDFP